MLLQGKNAVIYGGAGSVGSAVARAFAREGATVFLAGRTQEKLDALAAEIRGAGGNAETGQVDARNEDSVEQHLSDIFERTGKIDISFNLIGLDDVQGVALTEMPLEHFTLPIFLAMNTHFLTATAAGRYMAKNHSGVILALTANVARRPYPYSGGFGVACAAIEGLCRQLSVELGPAGVRVVCLRSSGSPDTPGVLEAIKLHADKEGKTLDEFLTMMSEGNMLKRLPLLADVANVAVLMASDYASTVTAAVTNVTCGELVD